VPLDKETIIASVKKTSRVLIAHEAHKRLGPGAEIAAMIAEDCRGLPGRSDRAGGRPQRATAVQPELENFRAA